MVIDADAPEQTGPVAHWAIPVEVPPRVIAELADQRVVIVRNGVVLYRHCTIPGCRVAHDRCKLHHIVWWRHGGRTDLDNLLAICSVHHTRVAEVVEGEFVTIRRRAPSVVHPRHQFPFAW